MQVPRRKREIDHALGQKTDYHLTSAALATLEAEVERLLKFDRPRAAEEVARTQQMGDLSENAAYQEAKNRLRRINSRITGLEDRIRNAVVITSRGTGMVEIGSTVVVRVGASERTYEIVGSQETDPARGRISHTSPLGTALLHHAAGETVILEVNRRKMEYEIREVR